MKKIINKAQSQSAALILGRVLHTLFSDVQLLRTYSMGAQFCYEIVASQSINEIFLEHIEREMLEQVEQSPVLEPIEMVAQNARELFKHRQQSFKDSYLDLPPKSLVSLVRIEDYYDLSPEAFQEKFEGVFKLTHIEYEDVEVVEKQIFRVTRICGVVAENKQELKKRLQALKQIHKVNHEACGVSQKLFNRAHLGWIFQSKGIEALEKLKNLFSSSFKEFDFQEVHFSKFSEELFKNSLKREFENNSLTSRQFTWAPAEFKVTNPFLKGLFSISNGLQNHFGVVVFQKQLLDECIYCLNFYLKMIKILDFSYEVEYSCGKQGAFVEKALKSCGIEEASQLSRKDAGIFFRLVDHWGRSLASFNLEIVLGQSEAYLNGSCDFSLEKLLGWLIEKEGGILSKKLKSLEVRFMSLKGGEDFLQEVLEFFKANNIVVTVDDQQEKLQKKLYKAFKEKIPCVGIIGEKEAAAKKITFREAEGREELFLTKEELLEKLSNL
ncbi:MAG: hypothetical protein S4CHLAM7_07310 [Chlamydiae bacterium]|nr:hypothetical protein [Chlamydiota bacterium]